MMKNKYKHVFLVAMGYEIKNIFEPLGFRKNKKQLPYDVWEKDNNLVINTGVSKTNAAGGTQWAIDSYQTKKWINVGLCGSLKKNFKPKEVIVISECRFYDIDNRGLNSKWKIGQIPGDNGYIFRLTGRRWGLKTAKIITGDQFVTDKTKLKEIINEYKPDLIDEEAAAVAKILKNNKQLDRLTIFKVVSDNADENASDDFNKTEGLFDKAKDVIKALLA